MSLKISKYFRLIDFMDHEKAVTTQHVLHESRKNLMGHEIPMKAFFDHHRLIIIDYMVSTLFIKKQTKC